jgi:hypothetical protein
MDWSWTSGVHVLSTRAQQVSTDFSSGEIHSTFGTAVLTRCTGRYSLYKSSALMIGRLDREQTNTHAKPLRPSSSGGAWIRVESDIVYLSENIVLYGSISFVVTTMCTCITCIALNNLTVNIVSCRRVNASFSCFTLHREMFYTRRPLSVRVRLSLHRDESIMRQPNEIVILTL